MSRRIMRAIGLSVVVLVTAAGCGAGGTTDVSTGNTGAGEEVPGRFGATEDAFEFVVATASHLVGLREDSSEQDPVVEALDLGSGSASTIEAVPSDRTFVIHHVAASHDRVLVAGVDCLTEGEENDPERCDDHARTLILDPSTGGWMEMDLPPGATRSLSLDVDASGNFLAVFRTSASPGESIVLRTGGEQWLASETVPDSGRSRWCVSGDALYQLEVNETQQSAPPAEGYLPEPLVEYVFRAHDADGTSRELTTPDLYPFFGGEGVHLACSTSGPILITSTGQASVPKVYVLSESASWDENHDGPSLGRPALVTSTISRAHGPALVTWEGVVGPDGGEVEPDGARLIGVDGASWTQEYEGDVGDARLVPIGGSPDTIVIGPLHRADPAEPGGGTANDPVSLHRIEGAP